MAAEVKDWLKLPGNEVGPIYRPSEENFGYKTFKAGFMMDQIKPGDLVRVYSNPSFYRVPIEVGDSRSYELTKEILGFQTYSVTPDGKLASTILPERLLDAKKVPAGDVLKGKKIYRVL